MNHRQEKFRRLALVARLYYLENQKQSDIARQLNISRPMVSRMLTEARELGVVQITIREPEMDPEAMLDNLIQAGFVKGGILVTDGTDEDDTNQKLSEAAVRLLQTIGSKRMGIGWGYLIGQLVAWMEAQHSIHNSISDIFPLVGNASIPARNYQSNENVRLMAQQLNATPHFLPLPALPASLEEKNLFCSTELYHQILKHWNQMDTALVNIGNYPSSPDFASLVRYGNLLQENHTCGRLLIYYFNEAGTVIHSDQDFAIQIPLDILRKCPNIIGICSANTNVRALRGALHSGLFTHIIARADLVKELISKQL